MSRRISALLSPGDISKARLDNTIAVVVDVLRATSVIPVGLAAGATAFFPVATVDEARALRDRMPNALLCGEREGRPPEGFDLGNSPFEYTPERVNGRDLVFTSTNGAPALLQLRRARRVFTGAFVNESALLDVLARVLEDVVLVAAGTAGKPSLEDMTFCGALTSGLLNLVPGSAPDYAAVITLGLWKKWQDDVPGLLATSPHGSWLAERGFAADLEFCARRNIVNVVPILENDRLIALGV